MLSCISNIAGRKSSSVQHSRRDCLPREAADMRVNVSKHRFMQLACLSFWPILLCAQSSDVQNLANCKNGWETCDRSRLNASQSAEVAASEHRRDVAKCRNGYDSCDRSKLSESEAISLAVADHQRNVSDCTTGITSCDPSRLTESDGRESSIAAQQRNIGNCHNGYASCDLT